MDASQSGETPDMTMFLASAIHDMKNSLSVLTGFMEDSLGDPELRNQAVCKKMAPMLYEVKRLNANLLELLTIYKVDRKFYPFDLAEHAVDELAAEIEQQSATLLNTQNVQLELDVQDGLYWYYDRDLVMGVVSHALNNASRYTHGHLRLAAAEVDGFLELRVEDDGAGYPQSMIEQGIAVNRGTSFQTGSTGLGLYFSAMVAKMHKNQGRVGEIHLENGGKLGGGCFVLRLP